MKLSFKNRIALYNLMAVAAIISVVFWVVYEVVFHTAFSHLDQDIRAEYDDVIRSLGFEGDSIIVAQIAEWEEQEHEVEEINPTFLQLTDKNGKLLFRSSNLITDRFLYTAALWNPLFYNTSLKKQPIRLGQFPLKNDKGEIIGQLSIGISRAESTVVLKNLRTTLFIAFPLTLLILYFAVSIAAARSIAPVQKLIRGTQAIDETNVNTRLALPPNEDEVRQLAQAFNDLLQRIENSFNREKQFTSDASHELRTPLTAIRGILEVLIRKPRTTEHYEDKIGQVIREIDKMQLLLDRLLQLARLQSGAISPQKQSVSLYALLEALKTGMLKELIARQMNLLIDIQPDAAVMANVAFLEIMISNLLENSLKYGSENGYIYCTWDETARALTIADDGPGIPAEQVPFLFNQFYRADASRSSHVPGSGLGLSIVQKIAMLEHIAISVKSDVGKGMVLTLKFL